MLRIVRPFVKLDGVQCEETSLGRYRNLWETYYKTAHGIVFVVDSTDKLRLAVSRDELWMLLDHKDLANRKVCC